jgi:hypothetical protein
MAQNKTVENQNSVVEFLKTIVEEKMRNDCSSIIEVISKHTSLEPKMWGASIVGFGSYHYVYESGHAGDAPLVGLSPRANAITLYLSNLSAEEDLLKKLGKFKTKGGCVYIKKLEDIDADTLTKMVDNSIKYLKNKYPG